MRIPASTYRPTGLARRRLPGGVLRLAAILALGAAGCSDAVGPPTPASVELAPGEVSLTYLGENAQLTAVVRDRSGAALNSVPQEWRSEDAGVATVSSSGVVTATGNGTTRITVRAGEATGFATVTVQQAPAAVQVAPDSLVLAEPGETAPLNATVVDLLGNPVDGTATVWSSGDPAVAVVDEAGTVTAVDVGSTWIHARAGTVSDSVRARVLAPLTLVSDGPGATEAQVASELTLTARVVDTEGAPRSGVVVRWGTDPGSGAISSGAESVSDAEGFVYADWTLGTSAGPQSAAAELDTRSGTVTVVFELTATPGPAASATLGADSVLLSGPGEEVQLVPTVLDAWGNLTTGSPGWTSGDAGVATVTNGGLVRAAGAGSTWVQLSLSGSVDSVRVTVALRGAITLTFDDGWRSVYDQAWPVIQEFPGLRANVGVYTDAVGWDGYMTEAQLDELHAAGWSMVSHTVSHDSLTTLTSVDLDYELRASREWLDARGYRGSHIFIAPYHDFTDAERAAAAEYYTAARGMSATETVPPTLVGWMPEAPFHLTGVEPEYLPYTTAAGRDALRALLQQAVDEGAFLDVFFHKIPPERVEAFRAVLQVLWEFRDRVLPYHELFPTSPRVVY